MWLGIIKLKTIFLFASALSFSYLCTKHFTHYNMFIVAGLLIPFLGTLFGSAMVFLMKDKLNPSVNKLLLGFASGVMMAASVWSLLMPSLNMSADMRFPWLPAAVGFLAGMGFLLLLDTLIPHLHAGSDKPEGLKSSYKKTTMLALAVTLHNIPEGMAVGVVLASTLAGGTDITLSSALALSIGIAIQNFPEGAIVSMPLRGDGNSRWRAFGIGTLSGIVEPIFGLLTILLIAQITPILPYLLAFAAGAMIYVVVEELIPESQSGAHSNIATIGVAVGFVLMMILDVALG